MCSVGMYWFNPSKFPDCRFLDAKGFCAYSMSKRFMCLLQNCKFAKDCKGCVHHHEQFANGDDDAYYCGKGISLDCSGDPCFPCNKKQLQLDVLNERCKNGVSLR